MQHNNISIFIPHIGCPNKCSFCNQNSITGKNKKPEAKEVNEICRQAFNSIENKSQTEIAFFGGSFTAIPKEYMMSLLECVQEFIGDGKFKGIRISTRPDCIDEEILNILKKYNVTSIELGAQSMDDYVLEANDRGHSVFDVEKSSKLIKEFGFELGLQMMIGLYKSTPEIDIDSAKQIIALKPDTVRIYPVVILENTKLADLYLLDKYRTYSIDESVQICSKLIEMFNENNIKIIKLGLHASEIVEKGMVGGIYHPAFRELCENKLYYRKIKSKLMETNYKNAIIYVANNALSKAIGQKKSNLNDLKKDGYNVKIKTCLSLKDYDVEIVEEEANCI